MINHGALVFDDTVAELKRSYLRRKVIDLKLADESISVGLAGATFLDAAPYRLRLEVDLDRQPIEQLIAQIVASYRVADLTVEEPPLDEVIAAIYRATGRTAASR